MLTLGMEKTVYVHIQLLLFHSNITFMRAKCFQLWKGHHYSWSNAMQTVFALSYTIRIVFILTYAILNT